MTSYITREVNPATDYPVKDCIIPLEESPEATSNKSLEQKINDLLNRSMNATSSISSYLK